MNALEYAEKATEIFVLSDSFIRIKELIDDESSTIDDISDVIIIDPALASNVLKLANSSLFNYPGRIDTISKAVLVLGVTEVYNLVIAYFVTDAFKALKADKKYLEMFWEQSVDCALLIRFFGEHLKIPNAERLFILGLLHNIGELVVQQFSPEKVTQCHSIKAMPWKVQQKLMGFTFGACSAELLKQWQLPYSIVAPLRAQDDDDFKLCNLESKLLYLSKRVMIKNHIFKEKDYDFILPDTLLVDVNIDKSILDAAIDYCEVERLGLLAILNPST